MTNAVKDTPLLERAKKEGGRDLSLADEALQAADTAALHAMCKRLIGERTDLAQGIDALGRAFVTLREVPVATADKDAIAAVERIAHESITFARDVMRLVYQKPEEK